MLLGIFETNIVSSCGVFFLFVCFGFNLIVCNIFNKGNTKYKYVLKAAFCVWITYLEL